MWAVYRPLGDPALLEELVSDSESGPLPSLARSLSCILVQTCVLVGLGQTYCGSYVGLSELYPRHRYGYFGVLGGGEGAKKEMILTIITMCDITLCTLCIFALVFVVFMRLSSLNLKYTLFLKTEIPHRFNTYMQITPTQRLGEKKRITLQ